MYILVFALFEKDPDQFKRITNPLKKMGKLLNVTVCNYDSIQV